MWPFSFTGINSTQVHRWAVVQVEQSMGSAPEEIIKSLEERRVIADVATHEGGFKDLYRGIAAYEAGRMVGISRVGREYGWEAIAKTTFYQTAMGVQNTLFGGDTAASGLRTVGFSERNLQKNITTVMGWTGGNVGAMEKLFFNLQNLDKLPYITEGCLVF